ncbi:MAG TPA: lipopolysaccharide assembly protein LapA domain-containing protein [Virgibacillus sp.]|nr:lipopolysaccharide assembly protein LapA domain-containing protein [Virgibacillus sp.]
MKGQTYVILSIIFVILVAVFAVTNVDTVQVNYLFWDGQAPLILVILFSVLMGCVITAAAGVVKVFRLQRELRASHTKNQKMEKILKENGLMPEKEDAYTTEEEHKNKTK